MLPSRKWHNAGLVFLVVGATIALVSVAANELISENFKWLTSVGILLLNITQPICWRRDCLESRERRVYEWLRRDK